MSDEYNCSKCLVDHRGDEFIGGLLHAYGRPELWHSLGIKRSIKVAGVFNKITKQIHFLELVLRNRGWNVRVFTDYETALNWLKGSEG